MTIGYPMIPTSSGGGGGSGVTDHGALTGLTDDDHSQYVHISSARTVSAVHTFNPGSATAPFVLGANATGQLVSGLNADQVDGLEASAFALSSHTHAASDITSGTLGITRGGTGAGTASGAFDALSPMTTSGDIIYGGASGTGTRLAAGTNGQVLTLAAGVPSWATQAGGGDMTTATYDPAAIAEQLVGLTATQTLTNKTIDTASNTITVVEADISDLGAYITGITGEPLSDLSDVTITGIASGELLKWNGSAWINNTLAEAGISATGHVHAASDITSGTLALARGGVNADLSATGGSNQFLKQTSSGANITVAAIVDADVPESAVTQHQAAMLTLAENVPVIIDPALSADGKYSGITEAGTAGATLAFGDLVYLQASDSRWELADASAASTAGDVKIGICVLAAAADGNATTVLLYGKIRADAAFPTFTISAPVYISETAGDVTGTAPTTTDAVRRRVGFANTANELHFSPSNDYVTHT